MSIVIEWVLLWNDSKLENGQEKIRLSLVAPIFQVSVLKSRNSWVQKIPNLFFRLPYRLKPIGFTYLCA